MGGKGVGALLYDEAPSHADSTSVDLPVCRAACIFASRAVSEPAEGPEGTEEDEDIDEYTDDNDPGYVVLDVTDEEFHRLHKVRQAKIVVAGSTRGTVRGEIGSGRSC